MIEYKEEKKRIFFEGVEVASFSARYPVQDGLDKINSFLLMLVTNSLKFFLDVLCEKSREEYTNDESDKKRFYFKAYRYTLNIDAEERNDELHVTLDVSLRRGIREEVEYFHDEVAFDTKKQIIRVPAKKKRKSFK